LRLGFLVHERPLSRRRVHEYLRATEPDSVDVTVLTVADRLAEQNFLAADLLLAQHAERLGGIGEAARAFEYIGEGVALSFNFQRLAFAGRHEDVEIARIGGNAFHRAALAPEVAADHAHAGAVVIDDFQFSMLRDLILGRSPAEVVDAFAVLPVQDGGRVKPWDTMAGFKLLKLNGKRSVRLADDLKIGRTEWLLECLVFPERARDIECFLVRNQDVLIAADLEIEGKKKSDRYSYAELLPARPRLFDRAAKIAGKEAAERGPVETQTFQLAMNINEFEELLHGLDFARERYQVDGSAELSRIFDGASEVPLSEVLAHADELTELMHRIAADREGMAGEYAAMTALLDRIQDTMQASSHLLAIFPPDPAANDPEAWQTTGEFVERAFVDVDASLDRQLAVLARFERLVERRDA